MKVGPTPLSPPASVDRGGPVSAAHDPHQATLARLLAARHAGAGPHPSGTLRVRATLPTSGEVITPDRQRELRARHQHGGCTGASVDRDRLRLRRPKRGGNERFWVIGPRDYVDVLARQLAEDGAVAHAFGPDTRADWIDAAL